MIIQHNIGAINTARQFNIVNKRAKKSTEKLSSGYKVNRAADDAAGLSISEKMRNQIRGLNMAKNSSEDGISLLQTAEGALNEMHSIVKRISELSVKAANDVNAIEERESIQEEIEKALKSLFLQDIEAIGASRTDSGVSAKQYPVCFCANTKLPVDRIPYKLNRFLPKDIQAYEVKEVDKDFDLRKSVIKKPIAKCNRFFIG